MSAQCHCKLPSLFLSASSLKERGSESIGVRLFHETECSICLNPLIIDVREGDPLIATVEDDDLPFSQRLVEVLETCGHSFHTRCLQSALMEQNRDGTKWLCPKDRRPLTFNDMYRLKTYTPASDAASEAQRRDEIINERNRQLEEVKDRELLKRELDALRLSNATLSKREADREAELEAEQERLVELKRITIYEMNDSENEADYWPTLKEMEEAFKMEQELEMAKRKEEEELEMAKRKEEEEEQERDEVRRQKKAEQNRKKKDKKRGKEKAQPERGGEPGQGSEEYEDDPAYVIDEQTGVVIKSPELSGINTGHRILTQYETVSRIFKSMILGDDTSNFSFNIQLPTFSRSGANTVEYFIIANKDVTALKSKDDVVVSQMQRADPEDGMQGFFVAHDYRMGTNWIDEYTLFWYLYVFSTMAKKERLFINTFLRDPTDASVPNRVWAEVIMGRTYDNGMMLQGAKVNQQTGQVEMKWMSYEFDKIPGARE